MLEVQMFKVGDINTNCYVIHEPKEDVFAIIDPGDETDMLNSCINKIKGKIIYILLTHGHFDHIGKARMLSEETDAKTVIGEYEKDFLKNNSLNLSRFFSKNKLAPFDADICVKDGDSLKFGDEKIKVLHTPGHTVGGVCYIIGDKIFSGDVMMKGDIGRTDFLTGNMQDMKKSLSKLLSFPTDYSVYPGHGDITTIEYQKRMLHNF